jgi:hypothetical protein
MTLYRLHLIAGVLCLTSLISERLQANVILPTAAQLQALGATQYEIAFVTTQGTTASSSNVATYNSFATAQANQNSILSSLGVSWDAIVSTAGTPGVNAIANAPSPASIPVFNTQGQLVADSGNLLYSSSSLLSNIDYDQNGTQRLFQAVWTGSTSGGTANDGFALGSTSGVSSIGIDSNGTLDTTWIAGPPFTPNTSVLPLYALSSSITPSTTPEPATFSLLGVAVLGGVGASLIRRRKRSA